MAYFLRPLPILKQASMFTGIIEAIGTVTDIKHEGTNVHYSVRSVITPELKIDQSVSHNGVCLTVVSLNGNVHTVTAIAETLCRTNLGKLKVGDTVNLERAMSANARFDGHMVQGHVDQTAECYLKETLGGSWKFWFRFTPSPDVMVVEKGSVCVDGVITDLDTARPSAEICFKRSSLDRRLTNRSPL